MFHLEQDSTALGAYLRTLINKKYDSIRKFCRAYLELRDGSADDESIRKLLNRFSQILKGRKRIQIDDLPYVTELLEASCEEILSAGRDHVPVSGRATNYSVAFSNDPAVWQEYIDRDDKLILNYDEYGKSVLDYAYQFKNYPFLKYMLEQGYIVFKDSSGSAFRYAYGATTTIKRRDISSTDNLEAALSYSDELRMNMITLAIENKDYSVLEALKARETPMMHFAAVYSTTPEIPEYYDCSRLVASVAAAPDVVLDYFTKEYSIEPRDSISKTIFVFQHLDKVIETMTRKHDKRVVSVIKSAVSHNRNVYDQIRSNVNKSLQYTMKVYSCSKKEAEKIYMPFSHFHNNCGAFSFSCPGCKTPIYANIIRCEIESSDPEVYFALEKLKASYDLVKSFIDRRD